MAMKINDDLIIGDTNKSLNDIATYKEYCTESESKTNMLYSDGKPIYRIILSKRATDECIIPFPNDLDTLISFDTYGIESDGSMIPFPKVEISYTAGNTYGSVKAIGKNASWGPNTFYMVGTNNYNTMRVIALYTKTTD